MDAIFDAIGWLFRSSGRFIEEKSKSKPAGRVFTRLVLPIAAGVIVGLADGMIEGLSRETTVWRALFVGAVALLLSLGNWWLKAKAQLCQSSSACSPFLYCCHGLLLLMSLGLGRCKWPIPA